MGFYNENLRLQIRDFYDSVSLKITSIGIMDENGNSGHVFVKKCGFESIYV